MSRKRITRREFAGVLATAAAAVPALGTLAAQKKKPAEAEKKPAAQSGDDESQAMKRIRDFVVPEGTEPAFAFRADWSR